MRTFLSKPLYSEHRLKNTQQLIERSVRQSPQMLDERFPINSSQLISNNMTVFTIKRATHSKRIWMTASCERRNDDTRPRLSDFRSASWIQRDKEDIAS